MGKNIVICCDGTGNEFRAKQNTNVVKLFQILEKNDPQKQVVYYNPGIGTMHAPGSQTPIAKSITKLLGLSFGYGVGHNIADAYMFLMRHYDADDLVYLFGFSRGAYTVRALAGMLYFCGLLRAGSENLIPYALQVYTQRKVQPPEWAKDGWGWPSYPLWPIQWLRKHTAPDWHRANGFKKSFSRPCEPYFIGIWDTVKSVGWLRRRVVLPHTANPPGLRFARHAVSIDERRSQYRPNLWGRIKRDPDRDIQEVWFAGVHSDLGGSYPDCRLGDIALEWMVRGAQAHGLLLNADEWRNQPRDPDPAGKIHNPLVPFWWLLGWKGRVLPKGALVHETVQQRMQRSAKWQRSYRPTLPADAKFVP